MYQKYVKSSRVLLAKEIMKYIFSLGTEPYECTHPKRICILNKACITIYRMIHEVWFYILFHKVQSSVNQFDRF